MNRDSTNQNPSHDAAHNMTSIPVRPGSGTEAGNNVSATAVYDTFGQMANIQAGSNDKHYYVYDALGRRIAALQIIDNDPDEDQIALGRRYLYDGSMVASEYIFKADPNEVEEQLSGYTTLTNGYAELERIYVHGRSLEFCAIDFDQDSTLTNINDISECNWAGGLGTVCNDHAFYYYASASGEFAALGHKDDDQKILEYYRNRVFGEVVVLPIVDDGVAGGSTASDGIEDTPDDLADNNSLMMTNRGLNGDYVGRVSEYGNFYIDGITNWSDTTGIQFQESTGLYTETTTKKVGKWDDWKFDGYQWPVEGFKNLNSCVEFCHAVYKNHGEILKTCLDDCWSMFNTYGVGLKIATEAKGVGRAGYDFTKGKQILVLEVFPREALQGRGCAFDCILKHELKHLEDHKECVTALEANNQLSNAQRQERFQQWIKENMGKHECDAHRVSNKCFSEKLKELGIADKQPTTKDCKKMKLSKSQEICCNELVMRAKMGRSLVKSLCPKADATQATKCQ